MRPNLRLLELVNRAASKIGAVFMRVYMDHHKRLICSQSQHDAVKCDLVFLAGGSVSADPRLQHPEHLKSILMRVSVRD